MHIEGEAGEAQITPGVLKKLCHFVPCIFDQCPSYCMPEEGPDWTETWHESLVNAMAKYCSGILESDLFMICTSQFPSLSICSVI